MSDHRGIQDQDPAERLATALRRIAVGIERREAVAAATQAALEATTRDSTEKQRPVDAASLPAVAAELDALIGRLRLVLDSMPLLDSVQAAENRERGS